MSRREFDLSKTYPLSDDFEFYESIEDYIEESEYEDDYIDYGPSYDTSFTTEDVLEYFGNPENSLENLTDFYPNFFAIPYDLIDHGLELKKLEKALYCSDYRLMVSPLVPRKSKDLLYKFYLSQRLQGNIGEINFERLDKLNVIKIGLKPITFI